MPTILEILGWRVFFYSNEGHEPIHVHAKKADIECKYWIDIDDYDIVEAYAFNLGPKDRRQIRRIIFDHFGRGSKPGNTLHGWHRQTCLTVLF